MSVTEETIKVVESYAQGPGVGDLPSAPARKLAVVACMDARLMVDQVLGLKIGDAHIIRNAGGLVTDDALRSLIISHHLLGVQEFMIINHTDCGMLTFTDEELHTRLKQETGLAPESPTHFHAFTDLEDSVRRQIEKIKEHPWIPHQVPVKGFIYDLKTGKLDEVVAADEQTVNG